jgi:hypothetical protein
MLMERYADHSDDDAQTTEGGLRVTDESVVLRNYDGAAAHSVTVRLRDPEGDVAFERPYELGPGETVSVQTRLQRGVYTAEAVSHADSAPAAVSDERDSEPALVGSGPDETALVELGNGLVSVTEGVL